MLLSFFIIWGKEEGGRWPSLSTAGGAGACAMLIGLDAPVVLDCQFGLSVIVYHCLIISFILLAIHSISWPTPTTSTHYKTRRVGKSTHDSIKKKV